MSEVSYPHLPKQGIIIVISPKIRGGGVCITLPANVPAKLNVKLKPQ